MDDMKIARQILACVLGILTWGAAAIQAQPAGASRLIDTQNVDGMLQRAASVLFHTETGDLLDFTKAYEHLIYEESCEIAKYVVKTVAGAAVGEFLRLKVYPTGKSVVDLALVMAGGTITAAEPLQPVMANEVVLLDFAPALVGLSEEDLAAGTADGLAKVFQGLAHADEALQAPPIPAPSVELARKLVAALRLARPAMPLGSALPPLSALDGNGKTVSLAGLKGKATVVLMGAVDQPLSRAVMSWVQQYLTDHKDAFQLVEALQNLPETIAEYRTLGGQTMGIVVPDLEGYFYDGFNTVVSPTLYLFDKSGHLVQIVEPPISGPADLAAPLGRLSR
jgi:hypothetical protein